MSRPLAIAESVIAAAIAGSLVGLVEGGWLWLAGGPDLSMVPWAIGLYGGAAMGVGLGSGVVLAMLGGVWSGATRWAAGVGFAGALLALGGVVGRYVLNRDLFAEMGVPLWATALQLCVLVLLGGAVAVALARPAPGPRRTRGFMGAGAGWISAFVLSVGASALGSLAAAGPPIPAPSAATEGPNVLFVLVDTFRADHLDRPELQTPALDALRRDGVTFDQAFSQASWTRPGVASLWTSRTPSNHTATQKGSRLPEAVVTWAEVLQAGGWTTGALVNNINVTAGFGFNQGFDSFYYESPEYPMGATEGVFNLALYKVVHRIEERLSGGGDVSRYYAPAPVVLDHASEWIAAQGQGRWALSVHLMEPHDPYFDADGRGYSRAAHPEPDPSEVGELTALYGREVERLDAALGPFLEDLRSSGVYDNTLIVLTSDHGEEFFEHGGWWHGTSLYVEQTQVPLVVKLPGQEFGGQRAPWQVRAVDVAPTLAVAAGVSPDPSWEGRDLFAVGDQAALRGVESFPASPIADPAAACRAARAHPLDRVVYMEEDFEGNRIEAVRTAGFSRYLAEPGGSRELPPSSLFDVVADPGEARALLPNDAAICSRFLDDWTAELDEALRVVKAAGGRGVQAEGVTYTDEERLQLCALGYLTGADCE